MRTRQKSLYSNRTDRYEAYDVSNMSLGVRVDGGILLPCYFYSPSLACLLEFFVKSCRTWDSEKYVGFASICCVNRPIQ